VRVKEIIASDYWITSILQNGRWDCTVTAGI